MSTILCRQSLQLTDSCSNKQLTYKQLWRSTQRSQLLETRVEMMIRVVQQPHLTEIPLIKVGVCYERHLYLDVSVERQCRQHAHGLLHRAACNVTSAYFQLLHNMTQRC